MDDMSSRKRMIIIGTDVNTFYCNMIDL